MLRDFTYIDDIVDIVLKIARSALPSYAPYRVFNVGNNQSVELVQFIRVLESCIGKKAKLEFLPMIGDLQMTLASTTALEEAFGIKPITKVETGLKRFSDWYRNYYKVV